MSFASVDSRGNLIDAAQRELILGQGQLEMLAVARRAGVSAGLAYHHFGSKAGLIAAVVEAFYDQLEAAAFTGANCQPPIGPSAKRRGSTLMSAFTAAIPLPRW